MNRIGVGVALFGCALVVGCSSASPLPAPTVGPSGVTGAALIHAAALDRGSLPAATLDVTSGATSVNVTTAHLHGKLVTVATPPTSGQQPALVLSPNGVATLALTSTGGAGPSVVDVALEASVAWSIDLDGGATVENVDMRGGRLVVLDLTAGVTRATIDLSATAGTQTIHETGGASELTVDAPAAVRARVHVSGGAGTVTLGSVTHSGVGGDHTFDDPGYSAAADRVDLELTGGVSSVAIQRT